VKKHRLVEKNKEKSTNNPFLLLKRIVILISTSVHGMAKKRAKRRI